MRFPFLEAVVLAAATLVPSIVALASTDEIQDADVLQSGYLPNHNMDPAIVGDASFGQLWRIKTGGDFPGAGTEQFLAKPLVYTPSGPAYNGKQIVFAASETNWVYVMDAKTGTILKKKQLARPFLVADIPCNDVSGSIGITGTPVIDDTTGTVYFYTKTYAGAQNGVHNGRYLFHALDINTLDERAGFPRDIEGSVADNDATRYFTGGTHLQRPSLSLINSVVYTGFGGHCDLYNFTGWIIGVDKTTAEVKAVFTTESGSFAPPEDGTFNGGGGAAGIWQSGMGFSSDSPNRMFLVTGNGIGHENKELPASGRSPLGTLDECIVNIRIDQTTGKLSLQDYFEPYEYISLDAGDRDLGSSGLTLLDPATFSGGSVSRMGVTVGKNGKAYVVNLDNLGGFKQGPANGDAVIQTITMPGGGSIFGGVGSYPLEGGYIYMTPVGYPTQVYKLGKDAAGNPQFTLVAQTAENSAGRVGVGIPTITTLNGQAGTAILWVSDVDAGLRAYHAVPQNGVMVKINLPPTPAVHKFQRPVFGDGRLYLSASDGHIICLGSPVNLPLNCTSPIEFGEVALGDSKQMNVSCKANIAITSITGLVLTNPLFTASNSSLPAGPLTAGQTFKFPVTFNLTDAFIKDIPNTSAPSVKPGVSSGSITLLTVNALPGYSTSQPLALQGTTVSSKPFLSISPPEVDFGGLVQGSAAAEAGVPGSMVIQNIGLGNLTITGLAFRDSEDGSAPLQNVTEVTPGVFHVGNGFTAHLLPQPGSSIPPGISVSVSLNFAAPNLGDYFSVLTVYSNGGIQSILFSGTISNAPKAVLEISNGEGGWLQQTDVDFGNHKPGDQVLRQIRISNRGGSALKITKSKPPEGVELTATNPTGELAEGLNIPPNSSAIGNVLFEPALRPPNSPPIDVNGTWVLNTDDLTFGVHDVFFHGTSVVPQNGPLLPDGTSRFKYLGCYQDSANGGPRLFPILIDNANANENGMCQTYCQGRNSIFAGTEYHTQCWCGSVPPVQTSFHAESEDKCTWTCPADPSQSCGGEGGYINVYYDSTRYDPATGSSGPSAATKVGNFVSQGCYTEGTGGRALQGKGSASDTLTLESCAASCAGFQYFGAEYARECYCGNAIMAGSVPAVDGCTMTCAGNASEFCGGASRLSVYQVAPSNTTTSTSTSTSASATPSGPSIVQNANGYAFQGCYTEATNGRALTGKAVAADTMTIESCATTCVGFSWFGVEYGRECYCGDSLSAGSVLASNQADCSFLCSGNNLEYCGAGNRLQMYNLLPSNSTTTASTIASVASTASSASASATPTGPAVVQTAAGYNSQGCYTESTTGRALTGKTLATDAMTIELCAATCAGFTWFGVEYGRECYCGNDPGAGSVLAPNQADCSFLCPGNNLEYCGAGNRLQMYKLAPANSTTSTTSITATSTASNTVSGTTSSATPTGPVIVQTVAGYKFQSCYTEATAGRALSDKTLASDAMTIELCAATCAGFTWFGVEYGRECYCGNAPAAGSAPASNQGDCSFLCPGNNLEYCGAGNRLQMYKLAPPTNTTSTTSTSTGTSTSTTATSSTSSASVTPTGPAIVQKTAGYAFQGCYTEATAGRALEDKTLASDAMTIELCAATCAGFTWFGVEYGRECYCGNNPAAGSSLAPNQADCNFPCPGNSLEYCGAGNRLEMYKLAPSNSTTTSSTTTVLTTTSSIITISPTATVSTTTATTASSVSSTKSASATPTGPVVVPGNANFTYAACYVEPTGGRALPKLVLAQDTLTVEICLQACFMYKYAGVEYGRECWCGDNLNANSVPAIAEAQCNVLCKGNQLEYCGAGSRLNLYINKSSATPSTSSSSVASTTVTATSSTTTVVSTTTTVPTTTTTAATTTTSTTLIPTPSQTLGTWVYLGCANETNPRALNSAATASNAMTVKVCQDFCISSGFGLAGLEYGRECYCGNALSPHSALGQTGCNMACSGNQFELCGGPSRLSIYNSTTYVPPSTVQTAGNYTFKGCFAEASGGRLLNNGGYTNSTGMTVESCVAYCEAGSHAYAGVEYGQ
ncbi:MAG: hypothetical protein M1840_004222 [Geoglossum simile]|nr:MAG: hypothetical protein M1840_004222 [Geoglossum simile]